MQVYVMIDGSGRMRLGEDVIEVGAAGRDPRRRGRLRAFEAGPEASSCSPSRTQHDGDGEIDPADSGRDSSGGP